MRNGEIHVWWNIFRMGMKYGCSCICIYIFHFGDCSLDFKTNDITLCRQKCRAGKEKHYTFIFFLFCLTPWNIVSICIDLEENAFWRNTAKTRKWWQAFPPFRKMFFTLSCTISPTEPFPKQTLVCTCLQYKSFKNIGKRRTCLWRAILLSLSVFSPFGELSAIFIKFKILVRKVFEFGRV